MSEKELINALRAANVKFMRLRDGEILPNQIVGWLGLWRNTVNQAADEKVFCDVCETCDYEYSEDE